MKIISGSTHLRFNSRLNHACYAGLHDYPYVFDTTPRPMASMYDHKLLSILNLPIDDDWWFWIDDDAFFTQFPTALESMALDFGRSLLIFPKSPVNLQGGWTFLSSGNFFFKNCVAIHDFFRGALNTDLAKIKDWWDESQFGMFTNGDQDKVVWQLHRDAAILAATQLVPYDIFNTRPYHFEHSPAEHFLVHFAVQNQTKHEAVKEFQTRFKFRDDALVPSEHLPSADRLRHFAIDADPREKRWWDGIRLGTGARSCGR